MFTSNPSGPDALFFLRDLTASSNSFSVNDDSFNVAFTFGR